MEITPRELRDVEIRESFRGYSRDDVNELLERAAATLDAANERIQQMGERLSTAQSETGHTRETEDILHRTLLLAQRAADEAVGEATAKSRQMLDDAEIQARRVVADSESEARRRGDIERRRLEEEVLVLAGKRDALLADVEALSRFEADYRERMVRALDADLTALRNRPPAAPGTRPEPTDIELPVLSEGFVRREPMDASPAPEDTPAPPAPSFATQSPAPFSTPAPASSASDAAPFATPPAPKPVPAPAPSPFAAPPEARPSTDAPSNDQPGRASAVDPSATQAVDVQSLFERSSAGATAMAFDQPGAATATAAQPRPADPLHPVDSLAAIDGDSLEAEVLDDDAFFATLREAVHDETPLGPRDEEATGESMFFDQEAENPGFRDVFRRRR
jgi:cell division initiation protein